MTFKGLFQPKWFYDFMILFNMVLGFTRFFIHFLLLHKVLLQHIDNLTLEQIIVCLAIKRWYHFPLFLFWRFGFENVFQYPSVAHCSEPLYVLLIKCQRRGGYLVVHGHVGIHSCVSVKYPLLHNLNKHSTHILLLDVWFILWKYFDLSRSSDFRDDL